MASLFKRNGGFYTVQFTIHGKRKTLRLPTRQKSIAAAVHREIERIVDFRASATPLDLSSIKWIEDQTKEFRSQIAATGLIEDKTHISTIGQLTKYFQETFKSENDRSEYLNNSVIDRLLRFFPADQSIAMVTPGQAEEFRRWLLKSGTKKGKAHSESTVNNYIVRSKIIFRKALNQGWITSNPFESIKAPVCANPSRFEFITAEQFDFVVKLLGKPKTPEAIEHQLILALGRWGGLRLPSEPALLRWEWIDFDRDRFKVHSRKTKSDRVVPIFHELLPFFKKNLEFATDKEFVCPWLRDQKHAKFYQVLTRTLKKAEINPWKRLLQNLRASRSNEIERQFGPKIESAWIGHNTKVAQKNYFSVSDSDFDLAVGRKSPLEDLIKDSIRLQKELDKLPVESRQKLFELLQESIQS